MLKPIVEIYPVMPAKDEAEREALRPIGRDAKIFQEVMEGWTEIIVEADRLGLWGAAAIEHHFWSEGYQMGTTPGLMNAYWAGLTKQLHLGQLGYVLGSHDPIRLAEETALISHMTKGPLLRRPGARLSEPLDGHLVGQHLGATPTKSPRAAELNAAAAGIGFAQAAKSQADIDQDARNRAVFEENYEILHKAWTEKSFRHKGLNWEIPAPYEGIENWQLADAGLTQKLGAPNEVDEHGVVRELSVVPAPYQNKAPPVFVSGSGTPATIAFAARNGFNPVYFTNIDTAERLAQYYVDIAKDAGRTVKLGENQAVVRWLHFADTDEQAVEDLLEYDGELWKNFYCPMGKRSIDLKDAAKSAIASGLYAAGTVETVRNQLIAEFRRVPAEYIVLVYHYAMMPKHKVVENMKIFMDQVKPAIDEVIREKRG